MNHYTTSVPKAARSPAVLLGVIKFVDAGLIVMTALVSYWSRHGLQDIPGRYWLAVFICTLIAFQVFHMAGLYQFSILDRLTAQVTKITTAWLVVSLSLIALIFFSKTADEFSRLWAATWLVSAYFCLILSRGALKWRL
jgi:FlaA1/EpsC-like NDP-sugar epimerase